MDNLNSCGISRFNSREWIETDYQLYLPSSAAASSSIAFIAGSLIANPVSGEIGFSGPSNTSLYSDAAPFAGSRLVVFFMFVALLWFR